MISMAAFVDELAKIAAAPGIAESALNILKRPGVPGKLALIGGTAGALHFGGKEVDKYLLGRQMASQMENRG